MNSLNPTFFSFCNYAIPENEFLMDGLGDLLQKKSLPEIEISINDLLKKYTDIFLTIELIIFKNIKKNEFTYSDIIHELVLIYGKERCFPFTKEISLFCAKAYFSNPEVLDAYSLIFTPDQTKDILEWEIDQSIFTKLINK